MLMIRYTIKHDELDWQLNAIASPVEAVVHCSELHY
jgi:hypothetical protein